MRRSWGYPEQKEFVYGHFLLDGRGYRQYTVFDGDMRTGEQLPANWVMINVG